MAQNHAIVVTAEQHGTILQLIREHLPLTDVWAYGSWIDPPSLRSPRLALVAFAGSEQRRQISDLRAAFERAGFPFSVTLVVWDSVLESFQDKILEDHVRLAEVRRTGRMEGCRS